MYKIFLSPLVRVVVKHAEYDLGRGHAVQMYPIEYLLDCAYAVP